MRRAFIYPVLMGVFMISPRQLAAQSFSLYPFRISSESGNFQFKVSGRVILEGFAPGQDGAGLIAGKDAFFSGRGSLFGDVYLGRHLYAGTELRVDTGEAPRKGVLTGRIEQAFLRYTPFLHHDIHLQYGRFVSPFGAYNQRHDSVADPLIRPPLMYDYRTMVSSNYLPRSNDGFINWKYAPQIWRPRGAPAIWGNPYQTGLMASGGFHSFDYRLALMNSAPASEPSMWYYQIGREIRPSWVAHVGCRIIPEFYLGMAVNTGPYLGERLKDTMTEDQFNSYRQTIWELEFLFEKNKTQIRGELFHDTWQVEHVLDKPVDVSGYVEIKQKFLTGFHAALRFGAIRFNEIRRSSGIRESWDDHASRWQAGLGYRLLRSVEVKSEYMWNHTDGPQQTRDNMFSLQFRFDF